MTPTSAGDLDSSSLFHSAGTSGSASLVIGSSIQAKSKEALSSLSDLYQPALSSV
ncbi:unnamed protein product [Protopolystoma xenopodis]|uniref:Uncharacterized protein n=1 Tax=Protopolystoma xenopodis TaxID=117903 RepID=A0A3S5CIF9_9PLAT|nr:unnamed protein product [Protopolystoma xenopodis]